MTVRTTRVSDLTHTFRQDFPVGRYDAPRREPLACLADAGFRSNRWSLVEHTGTHVDAPSHFAADGADVSRLSAADLVVPVAVIDVTARTAADPDSAVTVADIERHEQAYGRL